MKKILIAEDEEPLAKALHIKLTGNGYDPKIVSNGKDAIECLQKDKYNLLLLDIMMPLMDGVEVIQKMREDNIKVPIIVLSNYSQIDSIKKVKDLGVKDYLVKSNTSLSQIVDKVLDTLKE